MLKFLVRKIFIIRDNEFLNNMIEQDMYIYITILINFIYSNLQKDTCYNVCNSIT